MRYLIEQGPDWTYADLEGELTPQALEDVAVALVTCAKQGVEAVRVTAIGTGEDVTEDVTEDAIRELAYIWPSDEPQPDFLVDSYAGQMVMREAA